MTRQTVALTPEFRVCPPTARAVGGLSDQGTKLVGQGWDGPAPISFRQLGRIGMRRVDDAVSAYRSRSNDPAAKTAHVDAGRQSAGAVADRRAAVLAENVMVALRRIRGRVPGEAADVRDKLRKRLPIGAVAVTIRVDRHEAGATKLNAGNSGRVPLP